MIMLLSKHDPTVHREAYMMHMMKIVAMQLMNGNVCPSIGYERAVNA